MKSLRILSLGAAGVLLLYAGTVLAAKPVPIFQCDTVITEPGKYFLTQSLFCLPDEQGIVVLSSDVTVDLKGHTITCDAANSELLVGAVLVGDYFDPEFILDDVRVRNGTVTGCHDGVIFFYTGSGKISKITATNNWDGGITLVDASNTRITGNTGSQNDHFIRAFWGGDNLIKENTAIENLIAIRTAGGQGNMIKGNSTTGTWDTGIWLDGDTDSTVKCNTSEWDFFAIAVGPFSEGNRITGNFINNVGAGITMYGFGDTDVLYEPVASGNTIKHNTHFAGMGLIQ